MKRVILPVSNPDPISVRQTFADIAHRYDLANHFLSGGIDFLWRKKLVGLSRKGSCSDILDLATGSGDVAMALRKNLPANASITGIDFCEPMLEFARRKRDRLKEGAKTMRFLVGDCLKLTFREESFDLVTIAFGLRNLSDRKKGLSEMLRVLKPGGRLIILEFSQPFFWFRPIYYAYLKGILPWMARLVTGDRKAYLYLGSSISNFPNRSDLAKELMEAGFERIFSIPMTFSIVAIHLGEKPTTHCQFAP